MPEVRPERTGWRDEELSRRHRLWGWDCPALDIDFLLLEYDEKNPAALVEYKNEHAQVQNYAHASYQALVNLGNRADLPVLTCRYTDNFDQWTAVPLNSKAMMWMPNTTILDECGWVKLLYDIRGNQPPQKLLKDIEQKKIYRSA